jgi:hypothetical protein
MALFTITSLFTNGGGAKYEFMSEQNRVELSGTRWNRVKQIRCLQMVVGLRTSL